MQHILVVAHKTLGGQPLLDEVRSRMESGSCQVHIVVPVTHPMGAYTEASMHADAAKVLEAGIRSIRELDATGSIDVTGEVGDASPIYAVDAVVNRGQRFDEIIVSTLHPKASRWLKADVPSRLARHFSVPVTHVVADSEGADR